jgi:nucleoside-diphosphate-sugar epimerase
MTTVVTGATGFLGSAVVTDLITRQQPVRILARDEKAELYRQTHVEGTRVLLRACQGQTQLRRIVHVSTSGVHGVTGEMPAAEDAPFAPTNPYEATKLEGEQLALQAYREQGLPVTVVRPGLVYGPGDLHLLGFFVSIKKGLFRVIAGGKALLHPVYIDDLIAALLLCCEGTFGPTIVFS